LISLRERHPEVTAHQHARNLATALGKSVADKHKIYLDTNFWILLREAAASRPRKATHRELLGLLRRAVSAGIALCPISDAGLLELVKQSDGVTRLATADLMDELSLGIALLQEQERVFLEWARVFSAAGCDVAAEPIQHMVWVKACYVLGFFVPDSPKLDQATNRILQKATIDTVWNAKLSQFIGNTENPAPPLFGFEQTAAKLNAASAAHAHEVRTFKQLFVDEIAGALDVFKGQMVDAAEHAYLTSTGVATNLSAEERRIAESRMHTMAVNSFRYAASKMAKMAPTLYINAMCHAAWRWDKAKKLNGHDLIDLHHAAGAIGYCDAFFTDSPLRALLTSGHVALDKEFGRTIASNEADAIEYVRSLLVRGDPLNPNA
jgi:hypothetical protein